MESGDNKNSSKSNGPNEQQPVAAAVEAQSKRGRPEAEAEVEAEARGSAALPTEETSAATSKINWATTHDGSVAMTLHPASLPQEAMPLPTAAQPPQLQSQSATANSMATMSQQLHLLRQLAAVAVFQQHQQAQQQQSYGNNNYATSYAATSTTSAVSTMHKDNADANADADAAAALLLDQQRKKKKAALKELYSRNSLVHSHHSKKPAKSIEFKSSSHTNNNNNNNRNLNNGNGCMNGNVDAEQEDRKMPAILSSISGGATTTTLASSDNDYANMNNNNHHGAGAAQLLTHQALVQLEEQQQQPQQTVTTALHCHHHRHHRHGEEMSLASPQQQQQQSQSKLSQQQHSQSQQPQSQQQLLLQLQPHLKSSQQQQSQQLKLPTTTSSQQQPPPQQQHQQQQPKDTSSESTSSSGGQEPLKKLSNSNNTNANISSLSEDNISNDSSSGTGSRSNVDVENNDNDGNEIIILDGEEMEEEEGEVRVTAAAGVNNVIAGQEEGKMSGNKKMRSSSGRYRRSSSTRRNGVVGTAASGGGGGGGTKSSSLSSSSSGERERAEQSGPSLPCSADVAAATLHHHHPDNWSRALLDQRRFMMPPRQQTSDLTVSSSLSVEATRASSSCSNSSYFALDDPEDEENRLLQGGGKRIIAIEGGMPGPHQSYPQDGSSPPVKDVGPERNDNHRQRKRRRSAHHSDTHDRSKRRHFSSSSRRKSSSSNPPSHDSSNSPRTSSLSASSRTGGANGVPSSADCKNNNTSNKSSNSDETGCRSMRGGLLSQTKEEGGKHIPAKWIKCYMELQQYHALHGNCRVPLKRPLARGRISKPLREFVAEQRWQHRLLRRGRPSELTEERMRLLENLGFEWRDSKRDAGREKEEWRRRFEELRKFQSKYGHCRVPLDKTSPNLLLGIWVKNQRKQYRLYHKKKAPATGGIGRGSSSFNSTAGPISTSMTKERIRLLKRIGFEWRLKDEYEWKRKFEELQLYKSQHGDCRVPSRYPANVALGRWVRRQRKQYRFLRTGRKSLLNEEKVSILEAIGFEWKGPSNKLPYDPVEEEEWKRKYEGLCQYKSEHGNCFIREDYTDISLVAWVAEQQNQYIMLRDGKPSSMSRERIRLLDKVGFCWPAPIPTTPSPTPNDGSETAAVLDLSIPALPHASIGLPISSESNYTASASAAVDAPAPVTQVHHLHKQTSHPDQSEFPVPSKRLRSDVDTLSSLPPVVDDPRWMGRYNELLQYRDQHGDCRVPLRYSENPALGRWVSAQRRDYKTWEKDGASSSLTEAKLNLLNSVGFVWLASGERGWGGKRKAAQDKLWSTRYDEMSQYKSQFGDCRVPKTCHQYPSLRRWVDIQRSEFAKIQRGEGSPILTGERIRLLDALGFEWGIDDRHMARSFAAAAKGENGDGVISTTQQSHRTSSLAVPSSDVDFSTLTPSRSFAQASSKHGEANNGEGGQKQPPKVSTMMIGTAGMHGQHQHHRHHHHMNSGVNLSNQQPSPLPTEISFRKRETDKGGG